MSLRSRVFLASSLLILVPIAILALWIRRETAARLTEQYTARVDALAAVIEDDLAARSAELAGRLAALRDEFAEDNRFRLAAVGGEESERPYLLDSAGRAMAVAGLSFLEILDAEDRIVASGHFRNEFGRSDSDLARALAAVPARAVLVHARRPDGAFLALARVDSLRLAAESFAVAGGLAVDEAFLSRLARGRELAVSLLLPAGAISSDARIAQSLARDPASLRPEAFFLRTIAIPLAEAGADSNATARLVVSQSRAPLAELLASLDRWLAVVLAATAAGTLVLAVWLSAWISRPIRALARQTESIDLEHLDPGFASDRADEVGALSRFLAAMTARLRASVEQLREAERRAALGDLARQVNHDIRNGVAPIRNVVRHLGQVARDTPSDAGRVLLERHATIESSLAYLEDLAANYARLSTAGRRVPVDVNAVVRQATPVGASAGEESGAPGVRLDLAEGLPPVLADATALRRVVENLVRNARESLANGIGTITVETKPATGRGGERAVALRVGDTGRGMTAAEVERIFEHFYTTKPGGTGLGLSIVKRLVSDLEGSVGVESEPGRGTTVTVTIPAAPRPAADPSPREAR